MSWKTGTAITEQKGRIKMFNVDPISMAYGIVIGTVITALVIIGAIYREEMNERRKA